MLTFLEQIPPLITAACGVIFALFVFFLIRMRAEAARVRADVAGFLDVLGRLPERTLETRHEGLQLSDIERAHHAARERSRNVQRLWADLEMSFEPYRGANGVQSWFVVRPVAELLPRSAVIDRVYQTSLHQAVPSVLTALGLLTTFLAILLALEGVSVQVRSGAEIVEGIGGLINGLAGKFLSSIVALFLAVAFTLIEKRAERKLDGGYDSLLDRAAVVIPALSPTRLLLDMQALSAKRTELLENFYGEMADRVVSLFRTEVIPDIAAHFGDAIVDRCADRLRPEPPVAWEPEVPAVSAAEEFAVQEPVEEPASAEPDRHEVVASDAIVDRCADRLRPEPPVAVREPEGPAVSVPEEFPVHDQQPVKEPAEPDRHEVVASDAVAGHAVDSAPAGEFPDRPGIVVAERPAATGAEA